MNIETKYNLNDEVYFFAAPAVNNIIFRTEHGKILAIKTSCCETKEDEVLYHIECFGYNGFHSERNVPEKYIFKSKKEAADYIAANATKIVNGEY